VPLSLDQDDLGEVLRRVLAGGRVFEGLALAAVRPVLAEAERAAGLLSARERQVLALLATKRTLADTAGELFVSLATVKSHTASIYLKLAVGSRTDAVERGLAQRILG